MASKSTLTSCYSVSCMDPRERIVEARYSKLLHLADAINQKIITGETAQELAQVYQTKGMRKLDESVNFYRNARAGGGWSLDAKDDLRTIKENGLNIIAVYSTRHRQCAAIGVNCHLYDQDVAVMIAQDFGEINMPLPPVFRAHLEVISKHEEFDTQPMNIKALVAFALINGTGPHFPTQHYSPEKAAEYLDLNITNKDELQNLAQTISMTPKGLLTPTVEFHDTDF